MSSKPRGPTIAERLTVLLDSSKKTQREIAAEVGYKNSNLLTMFKQGVTRIPLDIAPKLAVSLGIDPAKFMRDCLEEYSPNLLEAIEDTFGALSTENELEMLRVIRKETKRKDPRMSRAQADELAKWARTLT